MILKVGNKIKNKLSIKIRKSVDLKVLESTQ